VVDWRYYQNDAIEAIFQYFEWAQGNPVVAMPTGTGKSLVIGGFIQRVLQRWPGQRFIMATHVKELIRQNAEELKLIFPGAPIGIHSAGLSARDYMQPIIYGGIASMVNNAHLFGHRDLLLIDEAHLVGKSDEALYAEFIRVLKLINPYLKVIGFTATPYRMGMGLLTNGPLFTHICYDNTRLESFNRLIAEGYLAMLIPQRTAVEVDVSGLKTNSTNGDYTQTAMEERVSAITDAAIQETVKYANSRHSWLVFAAGVKNAEMVAARYCELGARAVAIHGGTKEFPLASKERDRRIEDYKAGKYQIAVNYNVLTTGFNHKPVDLIVMLRATKSVPLWVQMLGRGTRPFAGDDLFPAKGNCLVMDFAGNTGRLGPINDPIIPGKKGEGGGDAPVKVCEECGTYNHISARYCIGCGAEFEFLEKTTASASKLDVIRDVTPTYEDLYVSRVYYRRNKPGKNSTTGLETMRVEYYIADGQRVINEFVPIEHSGAARNRAVNWWAQRSATDCPHTIGDALNRVTELRVPKMITVLTSAKHPQVERCFYD
jgi:DNA repair protein RadD